MKKKSMTFSKKISDPADGTKADLLEDQRNAAKAKKAGRKPTKKK